MAHQPDPHGSAVLLRYFLAAFAVLVVVVGITMSTDDDTSTVATTDTSETSEATTAEITAGQTALAAVGCYSGTIDGEYGTDSNEAIRDFQAAAGLEVDGVFGPATLNALESAVAAGQIVCTTSSGGGTDTGTGDGTGDGTDSGTGDGTGDGTDTGTGDGTGDEGAPATKTATLQSSSVSQTYTVSSWDCTGEAGDLALQGEASGAVLVVAAVGGTGTLTVDGGTEADSITLNGDITAVEKTPGAFSAGGSFTDPNFVGEEFSLSGTC
jgi:peptidoglycan hydrolase-like protein with peptidoglycan-binding domain